MFRSITSTMSAPRLLSLATCLCFMVLFARSTNAEIRYNTIKDDKRAVIEFESFGFKKGGALEITVTNISYAGGKGEIEKPLMGFFLVTEDNWVKILMQYTEYDENGELGCLLRNPLVKLLFSFEDIKSGKSFDGSFAPPSADQYKLMFGNCMESVKVSMTVRTSFYNTDSNGRKDYLSAGDTPLPKIYFSFFVTYLGLLALWCYLCWTKRTTAHCIHYLMGVLLLMKSLDLLCESEDKSYTRKTGSAHGWDIAFYVFTFVKGITFFTVIVLIGTGWSFLKPFLQDREKRVLIVVIPLQVFANFAAVFIDETGPATKDWIVWTQLLLLLDVICCCAVLFPIIWSIKHLREAARTDGKAARSLAKLTLFRQYYIVVVCYIYLTRIAVFALQSLVGYENSWTCELVKEVVTLAFYVVTGYKFRPESHNPYFRLDEEEEAAAEEELKDVDFDI